MSKEQTKDLLKFLKRFDDDIKEIVLWLREFVWDLYPSTNELIYDNYNAYRYILVKSKDDFPKTYIKKLVKDAYANSLAKVKDKSQMVQGSTITKSISAVKRKPGRAPAKKRK